VLFLELSWSGDAVDCTRTLAAEKHADVEPLLDPQTGIAGITLTALELVLGIDNIIFISIPVDRLPPERGEFARRLGLARFMRN